MDLDKLKEKIRDMSKNGIPIPFLRDPKTNSSSVSLTMMIISFNIVLLGLIGKASGFLGGINLEQAIYWYMVTCGLYFGRKISNDKTGAKLDNETTTKEKEEQ